MPRRPPRRPLEAILRESSRRVRPSPDECVWFGLPIETPPPAHGIAVIPLTARTIAPGPEISVEDVWLEADVGDRWRAALRLVPYAGAAVVAEVRLFPRDEWPLRRPGEWRAAWLGLRAGRVTGQRPGRHAHLPKTRDNTASFVPIRHGITAQLLRAIPLGAAVRTTRETMAAIRKHWSNTLPWNPDDDREAWEGRMSRATVERIAAADHREPFAEFPASRPAVARPRRASAWSDRRYAQIAAAYVARVEAGSRHAVADIAAASRRTLSATQVRDALQTARERGLLTRPTQQGRPGGQLTPAAEALLHARARQTRPTRRTHATGKRRRR